MEFSDVINTQYAFHGIIVGCVLAFAILVFVFGFKSAEEPPFDKLTNAHEDRKGTGKKKKFKDKKNPSNGHATAVTDSSGSGGTSSGSKRSGEVKSQKKEHSDKSPTKEQKKQEKKSPSKAALKETKQNKEEKGISGGNSTERKARGKENVEVRNKKNKVVEEKPKDYDDGEWEQALSKRDKKNRKTALEEILPQKADKKKEKKKVKEEPEFKAEVIPDIAEEVVEIKETVVPEKSEPTSVETSIEPIVEETKPKKAKKKKQNSESSTTGGEDKPVITEETITQPKPQRQKKIATEEAPPPPPPQEPTPATAAEPEKVDAFEPQTESNIVFDELGDTWKEAKAPKKNQKKKSRKD